MKDKDNEAFESWWEAIYDESMRARDWRSCEDLHDNKYNMARAWEAAIQYKQKEIDELDEISKYLADGYSHVKAQNKKLREALNYYANKYSWQGTHIGPSDYWFDDKQGYYFGGLRAREALKEVGEE